MSEQSETQTLNVETVKSAADMTPDELYETVANYRRQLKGESKNNLIRMHIELIGRFFDLNTQFTQFKKQFESESKNEKA